MANVLDEIFLEEYDREIRLLAQANDEYVSLPKGSIQMKKIRGYEMPYLCYRENGKYISKYVDKSLVEELVAKIERRRYCKGVISECKKNIAKLKRVIPKEMLEEYERHGISYTKGKRAK